jgi:membrane-bound metal-dependent hydrolase YbcI (DUF457 family)
VQKRTHLVFALLLFTLLNFVLRFPPHLAVFALIGALLPDIDFYPRSAHRKLCHNCWFLLAVLLPSLHFALIDLPVVALLSIGFLSHLMADGATRTGIMPLWPLKLKFRGPIRTGGLSEYAAAMAMLLVILYAAGIIKIAFL